MKKQFAVIGLGRFGLSVAKTLTELGCEVLAIDLDEDRIKAVSDFVTYALVMDAMDEKALRQAGVQNMDAVVVSIGEKTEANILVVVMLKEMGIGNIIAKAVSPLHGKVLEHLKVQKIIYPERDMAVRVAHSLVRPTIMEQLELSPEYSIVEMPAPPFLVGKTLMESQLRPKYGVTVIAIKKMALAEKGERKELWDVNPLPTDVINPTDVLVLIGGNKELANLSATTE